MQSCIPRLLLIIIEYASISLADTTYFVPDRPEKLPAWPSVSGERLRRLMPQSFGDNNLGMSFACAGHPLVSSKTVPIRTVSSHANAQASELDLRISDSLCLFFVVNQATSGDR